MNTPENVKLLKAHDEILSKASGKDAEVQYHRLVWTTNQPTEPGYYWVSWRHAWSHEPDTIVKLAYRWHGKNKKLVILGDWEAHGLDIAQKWAGPIQQPEEPK